MKKILIHVNSHWWSFIELAESIKDTLVQFGFDAITEYTRHPSTGYDFVVHFGGKRQHKPTSEISVFIEIDHIELREQSGISMDYSVYTRSLHFFDYKKDLTKDNIYYCPIGYSRHFDTDVSHVDLRDNFHFGRNDRRRTRECFIKRHNLYNPGRVFGKERDELIVTSKVNVNSKFQDNYWFTPLHAALVLFKGKLYMQEDIGKDDYDWYEPYMIIFNERSFQEDYQYWITHDKERHDFEQFIYEDIKKNHSFEKYFYAAIGDLLEDYR